MNDTSIEHLLQSLQPTAPSANLESRIGADLKLGELFRNEAPIMQRPAPPRERWRTPLTWGFIGAAAAVLVMSAMPGTVITPSSVGSSPEVVLIEQSREWKSMQEGQVNWTNPAEPQREVILNGVERHRWIDPRDGKEHILETPVEDSVLLPAKLQ